MAVTPWLSVRSLTRTCLWPTAQRAATVETRRTRSVGGQRMRLRWLQPLRSPRLARPCRFREVLCWDPLPAPWGGVRSGFGLEVGLGLGAVVAT
jgi:hypothetical protein